MSDPEEVGAVRPGASEMHARATVLYMTDARFHNFVEAMAALMLDGSFTMEEIDAGIDLATFRVISHNIVEQLKVSGEESDDG